MNSLIKLSFCLGFLFLSCKKKNSDELVFGTSADYPPFEFIKDKKIVGFDVELAHLIAEKLSKKAKLIDMQFSSLLPALNSNHIDLAISAFSITPEREKNFDFSSIYHYSKMAVLFNKKKPIASKEELKNKKIACLLGSTMEIWISKILPPNQIILLDSVNQAIEALKASHVDGVIIEEDQAYVFSLENPSLFYNELSTSEDGYAIALKKGSPLKNEVNKALEEIKKSGQMDTLKIKWLGMKKSPKK